MPSTTSLVRIRARARRFASRAQAAAARRYFKTGPGEYGEGDRFLGLNVAQVRVLSKEFADLPPRQLTALLRSPWHEERLLALVIMVGQSRQGSGREQAALRRLYLRQLRHVNNWDLIDCSAAPLLRPQTGFRRAALLRRLARSPQLWRRRAAIVATFDDIRRGAIKLTLELSRVLLSDPHDLMHKACGWMLREAGKRRLPELRHFLHSHAARMPRTMLRYAIERLPEPERQRWLRDSRATH
jgi:3-methyladenine DNA glycosylase AlkD